MDSQFCLFIGEFSNPMLGMAALILAVISPFFVAMRLKRFRDKSRGRCDIIQTFTGVLHVLVLLRITAVRHRAICLLRLHRQGISRAAVQYHDVDT
jgi:hypothetical protein